VPPSEYGIHMDFKTEVLNLSDSFTAATAVPAVRAAKATATYIRVFCIVFSYFGCNPDENDTKHAPGGVVFRTVRHTTPNLQVDQRPGINGLA
jgi:hypothetical protein